MTFIPIVPDFERYPEYGRDLGRTFGEIGLAGRLDQAAAAPQVSLQSHAAAWLDSHSGVAS